MLNITGCVTLNNTRETISNKTLGLLGESLTIEKKNNIKVNTSINPKLTEYPDDTDIKIIVEIENVGDIDTNNIKVIQLLYNQIGTLLQTPYEHSLGTLAAFQKEHFAILLKTPVVNETETFYLEVDVVTPDLGTIEALNKKIVVFNREYRDYRTVKSTKDNNAALEELAIRYLETYKGGKYKNEIEKLLDEVLWGKISHSCNKGDVENYFKRFEKKNGIHWTEVRKKQSEIEEFTLIIKKNNYYKYRDFVKKYKKGKCVQTIKEKMQRLVKENKVKPAIEVSFRILNIKEAKLLLDNKLHISVQVHNKSDFKANDIIIKVHGSDNKSKESNTALLVQTISALSALKKKIIPFVVEIPDIKVSTDLDITVEAYNFRFGTIDSACETIFFRIEKSKTELEMEAYIKILEEKKLDVKKGLSVEFIKKCQNGEFDGINKADVENILEGILWQQIKKSNNKIYIDEYKNRFDKTSRHWSQVQDKLSEIEEIEFFNNITNLNSREKQKRLLAQLMEKIKKGYFKGIKKAEADTLLGNILWEQINVSCSMQPINEYLNMFSSKHKRWKQVQQKSKLVKKFIEVEKMDDYVQYKRYSRIYNKSSCSEIAKNRTSITYWKKKKKTPKNFCNLGDIYRDSSDYKNAFVHYKKALEINKSYSPAYVSIGKLYFKQKNTKKAKKHFEKAIALKSDNYESYYYLSRICEISNKKKAIALYTKAAELNPQCSECFYYRGELYLHLLRESDALKDFQQVLKIEKKDQKCLSILCKSAERFVKKYE